MPTPALWSQVFRVNNTITSNVQDSAINAGLADGRALVAWRDLGVSLGTIKYALLNADGSVAQADAVANQTTTGIANPGEVAATALANGGFALAWSQSIGGDANISARAFTAAGGVASGDISVNAGATTGAQMRPAIAGDGEGNFVIAWDDDTVDMDPGAGFNIQSGVRARSFSATGVALDPGIVMSDSWGGDYNPAIAIADGTAAINIVWDDDLGQSAGTNGEDSIRGTRTGFGAYRVDSGDFAEEHRDPDIAYSTGVNFMAVWTERVAPNVYQVNGAVNGGAEFKVNTSAHSHPGAAPRVVGLKSGDFLTVWNDGGFGGAWDVLGQMFSSTGAKIGSEFTITSSTTINFIGSIGASEMFDGRVLVTWDAGGPGISGSDAFARFIDPRQAGVTWAGGAASEQFAGTHFFNFLDGQGGDDFLVGGDGGNFLIGAAGADRIQGGAGFDAASWFNETVGATINLTNQTLNAGSAAGDRMTSIEAWYLTGAGDTFTNVDSGGYIYGFSGGDAITGGGGSDFIDGGLGGDTLNGGAGFDYASYSNATTGLTLNLQAPGASTGEAAGDTLAGFEAFYLTNFSDAFVGQTGQNIVFGLGGVDIMTGAAVSNDWFFGGEGDDTLTGGSLNDLLSGEGGNDVYHYNTWVGEGFDSVFTFQSGADRLRFTGSNFGFAAGATLNATNFKAGAAPAATTAGATFLYNTANGILSFDLDGTGAAFGGVGLAQFAGAPTLVASDFQFV